MMCSDISKLLYVTAREIWDSFEISRVVVMLNVQIMLLCVYTTTRKGNFHM